MKHQHSKQLYSIKLDISITGKDTSSGYGNSLVQSSIQIVVPNGVTPEQCIADEIGAWLDAELSKHEFKYPEA